LRGSSFEEGVALSWLNRFKRNRPKWPYYDSDYYKSYQPVVVDSSVSWFRQDEEKLRASGSENHDDDRIDWVDEFMAAIEPEPEPEPEPLSLPEDSEADFEEQLDRIVLENQDSDDEFNAALDELIDRMHNLGY
jgi:hypothetical protein